MSKALVLDFGGVVTRTLFETHPLSEKALGLVPGTLTWLGPFDPDNDAEWRAMQAEEISERDYWAIRMKETAGMVGESWTEFHEFVQRVRGSDAEAAIRPEALETIYKAADNGIKLAILSNELDLFYGKEFRETLKFLGDFDAIVDATYTGILKPDPRAYALVTDALGISAEHCVFVDDQIKNVRGASSAGMSAVHFDVTHPKESYQEVQKKLGI